jgi:hypothetical protein
VLILSRTRFSRGWTLFLTDAFVSVWIGEVFLCLVKKKKPSHLCPFLGQWEEEALTEMESAQRQVRLLIGGVLGVPGLLIALTFWADPLQIIHD